MNDAPKLSLAVEEEIARAMRRYERRERRERFGRHNPDNPGNPEGYDCCTGKWGDEQ